jgi:hypothetical protein
MQFENNAQKEPADVDLALSDTWRELLGLSKEAMEASESAGAQPLVATEAGTEIPALTNDPWAELQHIHGIEIIDLQQVHTQALNDLDMEQVLQLMQEQPAPGSQEK